MACLLDLTIPFLVLQEEGVRGVAMAFCLQWVLLQVLGLIPLAPTHSHGEVVFLGEVGFQTGEEVAAGIPVANPTMTNTCLPEL